MFRERVEHVIEKLDVGRNRNRTAFQIQRQLDLGLFGGALERRAPCCGLDEPHLRSEVGSRTCAVQPAAPPASGRVARRPPSLDTSWGWWRRSTRRPES